MMSGGALSPRDMEKARSQPDTALRTRLFFKNIDEKIKIFKFHFFFVGLVVTDDMPKKRRSSKKHRTKGSRIGVDEPSTTDVCDIYYVFILFNF